MYLYQSWSMWGSSGMIKKVPCMLNIARLELYFCVNKPEGHILRIDIEGTFQRRIEHMQIHSVRPPSWHTGSTLLCYLKCDGYTLQTLYIYNHDVHEVFDMLPGRAELRFLSESFLSFSE